MGQTQTKVEEALSTNPQQQVQNMSLWDPMHSRLDDQLMSIPQSMTQADQTTKAPIMSQLQSAYPVDTAKAANEAQATKSSNNSGLQERDWTGVGMLTKEDKDTGSNLNAMYIGAGKLGDGQYGAEAGQFKGTAAGKIGDVDASGTMNVFNAAAVVGTKNPDGSEGIYGSASATAISGEGSIGYSGNEITGGLSASLGAGAGIGIRDKDGDGQKELCGRLELGPFIAGACVEDPF